MKTVCLGELFDRLICSVAETIHPSMRANNGLDQAFVARDFRYTIVLHRGCCIFRLCRPRNSEFLVRPIPVGGTSGRYQEVIAGDDDALDVSNGSGRTPVRATTHAPHGPEVEQIQSNLMALF